MRYIFGTAGTGKTSLCLQEIIKENNSENKNNLILIVPEQFSLESEKKLIELSNGGAVTKCQVLSFNRLAFHIFREIGKISNKILEDNGKTMLLKKIVFDLSGELKYFAKASNKQGFMEDLSKTISEFYKYLITEETLKNNLELMKEKEGLYYKMEDLYNIYKNYVSFIKEKYISTDETLDFLSDVISESSYIKNSIIWVDSFTGFTPQEHKVIGKLLLGAKQVNVSISVDENKIKYKDLKIYDPYYETKITINKLTMLCEENKIIIDEPLFLKEPMRFLESRELNFLAKNYLSYKPEIYEDKTENIIICRVSNIYAELTETAKKIHNLVSNKNFRYKEIAIVTASVEDYEKIIKNIFDTYEIPCFFDTKSDILSHPLTELIRSLIDIVVSNYSYESIFRFLKTNMTSISKENIDMLENYVLAYGIKSYKWKMNEWKYGFSGDSEIFDKDEIHKTKEDFLNMIKPFAENLKPDSKCSVKEFSLMIFNTLNKLNVTETLEDLINTSEDNVILRQHKQIWGKIIQVFEKMVEILGEEIITVREFGKILEAGFSEVDLGIIPPTQDCVIIGDYKRTRLPEIKAVFIIGVNEGIIPGIVEEKGLLTDEERLFLNSIGMELEEDSRQKTFFEQFLIYSSLTKAGKYLHLSYSLGTITGKTLQPSSILSKLKRIFPKITLQEESTKIVSLPKPTFLNITKILRDYANGLEVEDYHIDIYNWFKESPLYSKKINKINDILFDDFPKEYLSKNSVSKLYNTEIITNVSRLEKFVVCPFAYFVEYNLEAKERKQYEATSIDFGNLFHRVIEEFSKKLYEQKIQFRDVTKEQIDELVDECVDIIAKEIGEEVFFSTSRLKYAVKRIKRISKQSIWALVEHVKLGNFEPLGNEMEFSIDSPLTSIVIEIKDGKKLMLAGRIDRVDILDFEGNKYVKVIDYKSGSKKFDLSDIYYGMQIQLLLYLDAFVKSSPEFFKKENLEILPGGVFYFNINDPILDYNDEADNDILELLKLKEFKMSGIALKDENIVKAMDNELDLRGESIVIPVSIKKSDGEFGKTSSIATEEEFNYIREFVNNKIKELGEEIFNGNINVYPYKKGNRTGCDYCKYSGICQIDARPNKFNLMKEFKNTEDVLNSIKEDNEIFNKSDLKQ